MLYKVKLNLILNVEITQQAQIHYDCATYSYTITNKYKIVLHKIVIPCPARFRYYKDLLSNFLSKFYKFISFI